MDCKHLASMIVMRRADRVRMCDNNFGTVKL